MSVIVVVSGSPTAPSRTDVVAQHLARRAAARGHEVREVVLRDLPAEPLLRGRTDHPDLARALRTVRDADALIIATPVFQASYTGLLKTFLDVLPRGAFAGKDVFPIATGGSLAHALVIDYALAPVLRSLQPGFLSRGRFIVSTNIGLHEGGGAVLAPEALSELGQLGGEFIARIERRDPAVVPLDGDVTARVVDVQDPALDPLLEELEVEYGTRYAQDRPTDVLAGTPLDHFTRSRGGAFVVLERGGIPVAGGALRRRAQGVAEVRCMWTAHAVRRQGLARRVLAELESEASALGYDRLFLTTGARQPEARELYLNSGFQPLFDVDSEPQRFEPLPFEKALRVPAALAG